MSMSFNIEKVPVKVIMISKWYDSESVHYQMIVLVLCSTLIFAFQTSSLHPKFQFGESGHWFSVGDLIGATCQIIHQSPVTIFRLTGHDPLLDIWLMCRHYLSFHPILDHDQKHRIAIIHGELYWVAWSWRCRFRFCVSFKLNKSKLVSWKTDSQF